VSEWEEIPRGLVADASAPLPVIQHEDGSTEPAPAGSVLAEDIIGQLTNEQIAEIEAAKVSGKLTSEQIETIQAAQIVGELVNSQIKEIAAGKISGFIAGTQIAAETITGGNIKALTVTSAKIAAEAIITEKLATGSVITSKLAAEAITAEKISAGAITTSKLAAGSVVAEKLNVSNLSAISANLGTVTAGQITAVDITLGQSTGGVIKSYSELNWENHEKIYGVSPTESEDVLYLEAGGVVAAKDRRGYIKARARKISLPTGYIEKTIINGNSESDFLQLIATAGRRVNFGTAVINWPGGAEISSSTNVTHELGATPKAIVVTSVPTKAGALSLGYYFTPTSTQFTIRCYSPFKPAAGDTSEVTWIAIG
jgi:PIN domain nuclease of toxin-antitoxin system